jgi:fibronectin-binding autotransporter adhesin
VTSMIVSTPNSSTERTAKRLPDPTLSSRAFAVFFIVTILIAISLLLAPKAGAANDLYWDANGTGANTGTTAAGTWGTDAFWNTSSTGTGGTLTATTGNTNDLHFSSGTNYSGTFTVTTPNGVSVAANGIMVEEGNLTIDKSAGGGSTLSIGAGGITINSGAAFTISGSKLTLSLTAAQSWINNSSNLFSISVPVTNGANLLTIGGTGDTTISGVIGNGSGGLTKSGSGTLTLSGANTYTGATTISAGTLSAGNVVVSGGSSNLGNATSAVILGDASNQGTLSYTGAAATYTRGFTINAGGGQLTNAGSGLLTVATGGISAGGLFTVGGTTGKDITISSVISGTGGLTKTGADILTLSGANTYTGVTRISAGTLSAGNVVVSGGNSNLGNATSAVILGDASNQGTLNYTGAAATYTRGFTINAGGGQLTNAGSGLLTVATGGISAGGLFTVGGTTGKDITISSVISGTGGLTKTGADVLTLTGANTYSGATTISASGGTLKIDNNNTTTARLASTSSITVNSGGTLLLAQSGGTASTDRINNSAGVTISGGGAFKTGGLSEGTRPSSPSANNGSAGMGALTLTSTSAGSHATIDFATGALGSSLVFSSLSGGSGAYLDILNWTGALRTDSGATTNDRLLFASNPSLSETQLAHFQFFNDAGVAFATGATIISYGNEFELVPVPEPSTWIGGALTLGAIGFTQRRRLCSRRLSEFARVLKRAA